MLGARMAFSLRSMPTIMSAERINILLDRVRMAADILHTDNLDSVEHTNARHSTSNMVEELAGIFKGDYWPDERGKLGERVVLLREAIAWLSGSESTGRLYFDLVHVAALGLLDKLRMDVVLIERQRAAASSQTSTGDPV